ncbi:hypothetical protein DFA_10308 [Cavenderia fasciculata]|uniref:Uncharacterized protein n=1 Tax=Cavenderia fasciculata TaxID=261658 RepID=F4Q9V0_CACFS|nr:uncharacterized protein DFA_10308 [Cavenderia fasciculata]EGG15469.1 hypothetical protein DFA_10308 [Cavenderia fasciculata]|eukprot:XP_004354211.1 hypothetical protein DFA_10308 [Cavenderia fasciculata]
MDQLFHHVLITNKYLSKLIWNQVPVVHRVLQIDAKKESGMLSLADYITYGITDRFIQSFTLDYVNTVIDRSNPRYYSELFELILKTKNQVAMIHMIDILTRVDRFIFEPHTPLAMIINIEMVTTLQQYLTRPTSPNNTFKFKQSDSLYEVMLVSSFYYGDLELLRSLMNERNDEKCIPIPTQRQIFYHFNNLAEPKDNYKIIVMNVDFNVLEQMLIEIITKCSKVFDSVAWRRLLRDSLTLNLIKVLELIASLYSIQSQRIASAKEEEIHLDTNILIELESFPPRCTTQHLELFHTAIVKHLKVVCPYTQVAVDNDNIDYLVYCSKNFSDFWKINGLSIFDSALKTGKHRITNYILDNSVLLECKKNNNNNNNNNSIISIEDISSQLISLKMINCLFELVTIHSDILSGTFSKFLGRAIQAQDYSLAKYLLNEINQQQDEAATVCVKNDLDFAFEMALMSDKQIALEMLASYSKKKGVTLILPLKSMSVSSAENQCYVLERFSAACPIEELVIPPGVRVNRDTIRIVRSLGGDPMKIFPLKGLINAHLDGDLSLLKSLVQSQPLYTPHDGLVEKICQFYSAQHLQCLEGVDYARQDKFGQLVELAIINQNPTNGLEIIKLLFDQVKNNEDLSNADKQKLYDSEQGFIQFAFSHKHVESLMMDDDDSIIEYFWNDLYSGQKYKDKRIILMGFHKFNSGVQNYTLLRLGPPIAKKQFIKVIDKLLQLSEQAMNGNQKDINEIRDYIISFNFCNIEKSPHPTYQIINQ